MKNITTICALLLCCPALGGENAAPSSHMVFDDNFDGDILINEVRVPKGGEAMYTYYEALGWRGGAASPPGTTCSVASSPPRSMVSAFPTKSSRRT